MPSEDRDDSLVVIVPVLRRPHRVEPLLRSLRAATPEPHRLVFVATSTDRPMIDAVLSAAEHHGNIVLEVLPPHPVGDYARKVNHVIRSAPEAFAFFAADDVDFHPGWFPAALALMADPAIGIVGTQDLAPTARARSGEHATHCLVRRSYVEEFGTIDEPGKLFHEGYVHEYVDDEVVGTAKARGAWAFAAESVVEHLHPSWGKAPRDKLYNDQQRRMMAGAALFKQRRRLWENLPPTPTRPGVSVIVATFGDSKWEQLARTTAVPSAEAQHPLEVIVEHGATLAEARNAGAARATGEWLCFLDADDELEPGYLAALLAASGDLRAPAVRYVNGDEPEPDPVVLSDRNIATRNPCVVGTLVRRSMFYAAEQFWPERAWEDWSLFRRCWLLGAKIEHVPAAVYRARVNPQGRNSTVAAGPQLLREITASHNRWNRNR